MVKFSVVFALAAVSGASAFAPAPSKQTSTSLNMKNENVVSKFLTTSIASALIFSSAAVAPIEAQALSPDFGTDNVIAARSGGRAGGRSSASTMRSPPPSQRSTTVNNYSSTTVVAPASPAIIAPAPVIAAPVVVAPPISPFGGIGYGALGVVSAVGNEMREIRQENELARERAELQESKQRQFALEQRLNDMERREQTNAAVQAAVAAAKQ